MRMQPKLPKFRTHLRLFLLVLVACALAPRCACTEESKLVVGWALPFSGEFARYGIDIQRGAIMAQEELAKRGIQVLFVSEDTQLLPRIAATSAQKLINRDKVDVIVSLWDTAEVVAPIAEQRGIPHVSIRWNHRVAHEFPHTFTFESTYESWVRANLEYLRSQGIKRLAVMTDGSANGWVLAREYLKRVVGEYGISIVRDVEFMGASGDIKLSIAKLLAESADCLFMLQFGSSLVETMKRLGERKVATPILGYFDGMTPPSNIEGRRFVAQFDTQKWFMERFTTRFAGEIPIRAAFGYDLVSILGQVVERKNGKPSTEEILNHLNSLHEYHGATGTISANNSRNIETSCLLKEIRNGIGVPVLP